MSAVAYAAAVVALRRCACGCGLPLLNVEKLYAFEQGPAHEKGHAPPLVPLPAEQFYTLYDPEEP